MAPVPPLTAGGENPRPGRRPSMADVARQAGLSHQTVSRVVNNDPTVRPHVRERVQEAISELGYRRNLRARALATDRSGLIGILNTAAPHSGPTGLVAALEQAARGADYFGLVAIVPSMDGEEIAEVVGVMLDQGAEGVIVVAASEAVTEAANTLAGRAPMLLVSSQEAQVPTAGVDQGAGVELVVEHLLARGHRDLVHIRGAQEWYDGVQRSQAWWKLLRERGVEPRPDVPGDWTAASGYAAGKELVKDLPDAVFAANDQMALGLLRAFHEAGVDVPQDVAVVGFDDAAGSAYYLPPLTTVRQDLSALGRRAVAELLHIIGGSPGGQVRLLPELVVRDST